LNNFPPAFVFSQPKAGFFYLPKRYKKSNQHFIDSAHDRATKTAMGFLKIA
jgi:hypothetical protein